MYGRSLWPLPAEVTLGWRPWWEFCALPRHMAGMQTARCNDLAMVTHSVFVYLFIYFLGVIIDFTPVFQFMASFFLFIFFFFSWFQLIMSVAFVDLTSHFFCWFHFHSFYFIPIVFFFNFIPIYLLFLLISLTYLLLTSLICLFYFTFMSFFIVGVIAVVVMLFFTSLSSFIHIFTPFCWVIEEKGVSQARNPA